MPQKPACKIIQILQKIAEVDRDVNPPNVLQCNHTAIALWMEQSNQGRQVANRGELE
ncbi:hypothetical protein MTX26_22065 [Bradyrhizobium sp. ISRA443]|uniref:hypothetical protein n=1 Tax=unclassified Bradyrhizobium TaxID=2631580 RepID=UPI002478E0DD|nr:MULTISPECIES: hypothetical protein [unclassified Bradyrhizobium]WGR92675.1 hypothetical protein MTX20_32815 [Bradyrhizobium sp. ISRA435]WGR97114.1 hypothetical protein MTX23_22065 [Bradyrhizobium sp. ISRA436]WGS04002.1 hypothetical protein MTX18_22065 [Bradyrhizobium sp. ISRA437]WGS10885.1 hypothetical protein MTX26_22065 [Bradyrhizobium sp. ISRA443]